MYQLGRISIAFKTCAADSGGAYSLLEAIEPPGSGAGLHRHPHFDETFFICEGHYEFQVGDNTLKLGPGETVFIVRGTPHGFKSLGPEVGRQLIISAPGGIFERFIESVATAMNPGRSTAAPGSPPDFAAIAHKHGIEFMG